MQDNMTMDFDERYFHGKPQNSFHKAVNIPDVAVFPRKSMYDAVPILAIDSGHRLDLCVPIVPYGGATSLAGHTLSPHAGAGTPFVDFGSINKAYLFRVNGEACAGSPYCFTSGSGSYPSKDMLMGKGNVWVINYDFLCLLLMILSFPSAVEYKLFVGALNKQATERKLRKYVYLVFTCLL
ncbi:hypothetical protein TEA_009617 [Camellia sinensis var. sinensis]|uniref:Uncharacterized protein n=1 Tax=Camellia sinensis var. sinensis TaxID=542762 RepID=A0A4S4DWC8_CAMSN|nr:hypothetical protein TEA_009617 [Camellia sinensis var. sinensis]